jgi:hypothetical protein
MSVTAYKTCGTAADQTGDGNDTWTNPTNAQGANDASYATVGFSVDTTNQSDNLKCTNYGFSSSDVPVGATINGIEVVVRNKTSLATTFPGSLTTIKIVKGGTIQTTNRGPGSNLTTSDRDDTYGGSSDLWGTTWSQSDIVASGFGVSVTYSDGISIGSRTISVDSVQIRVYYTVASALNRLGLNGGVQQLGGGIIMFQSALPRRLRVA